jgi:crossover junction endodeoxyribonuclease RuvC
MVVMGIDPGTLTTGYGFVRVPEGRGTRMEFVDCGGVRTSPKLPLHERLLTIHDGLAGLIKKYSPDAVVVENVFFADNAKSALKLGHARGVALLAAAECGASVHEYSPLEIKQAVAGYGHADKDQVMKMVMALLGLKDPPKPNDASDALAAAICHINSAGIKSRIAGPATGVTRRKIKYPGGVR